MKIINKALNVFFPLLFITNIFFLGFYIYKIKNIENILRLLIILFLFFLIIHFIIKIIEVFKSRKNKIKANIIYLILSLIFIFLNYNVYKFYNYIDKVSSQTIKYTSVVVSKTKKKIENIHNSHIGIVSDENSIENFQIPKEIIKDYKLDETNTIKYFETTEKLISALNNNKISYAITSINYNSLLTEPQNFKVIYKRSRLVEPVVSKNTKIETPITILLLGVDSEDEGLNNNFASRSDTIILITFNPKTYNSTILSIPRDTFVPISCIKNNNSKITHSGSYGEQCVIKTLENLTDIKIDHFVKINFKGLVNLVEAIDGIYVDVPYAFCEQDSNRNFGKNTIYVEKGYQKLNGEQALAFTRNRHSNSDICEKKYTYETRNDFVRNQNQQKVISSITNELKNVKNINQLHSILNVIENNTNTSFNTNEILSFYNIGKKIFTYNLNLSFEQLYLSGYTKDIHDFLVRDVVNAFIYYKQSLEEVTKEMKINLELEEPVLIKEFSFSKTKLYEKKIVGKGFYNEVQVKTLLKFVNKNLLEAINFTNNNNIKLIIEEKTTTNEALNNVIYEQSIPNGYLVSKIKNLTVKVYKYSKPNDIPNSNENLENESIIEDIKEDIIE